MPLVAGISDTFRWILWCLHTSMARRIRTARFWLVCGIFRNGLLTALHGISRWFVLLPPLACTASTSHQSIPYTGTGHAKGDIYSRLVASFYSPLVVRILWPWNSMFVYHGLESITFSSMSSHKKSFIGNSYMLVTCIHDKWSTIVFSTPFLSLILR